MNQRSQVMTSVEVRSKVEEVKQKRVELTLFLAHTSDPRSISRSSNPERLSFAANINGVIPVACEGKMKKKKMRIIVETKKSQISGRSPEISTTLLNLHKKLKHVQVAHKINNDIQISRTRSRNCNYSTAIVQ